VSIGTCVYLFPLFTLRIIAHYSLLAEEYMSTEAKSRKRARSATAAAAADSKESLLVIDHPAQEPPRQGLYFRSFLPVRSTRSVGAVGGVGLKQLADARKLLSTRFAFDPLLPAKVQAEQLRQPGINVVPLSSCYVFTLCVLFRLFWDASWRRIRQTQNSTRQIPRSRSCGSFVRTTDFCWSRQRRSHPQGFAYLLETMPVRFC